MYIFQLGKNPKIAVIELLYVLFSLKLNFQLESYSDRMVIITFEITPDFSQLQSTLASTVRIIKVLGTEKEVALNHLYQFDIFIPKKSNIALHSIGLSNEEFKIYTSEIKKYIKKLKGKHFFKQIRGSKEVDPKRFHSWNLQNGLELSVIKQKNEFLIGQTIACTSPADYIFKDLKRPERFFTHGTSFRLAKTMVNILNLAQGQTFVDPFCGTGTFLIEGLLKGNNVIGIDNDIELINACKKNIKWFVKEFSVQDPQFKLHHEDSRFAFFRADGCVFEPYMGPFLKNSPNTLRAQKIMNELNHLYSDVFKNVSKNLASNARVICILPEIISYKKEVFGIDIQNTIVRNKFRFVNFEKDLGIAIENPIVYSTPDGNKIRRKLYFLEKT